MTTTVIRVGDVPVEIRYDGSRHVGSREVSPAAAGAATRQGALRYSPAWRRLALAFCAERDNVTEDRSRLRCATEPTAAPAAAGGRAPESSVTSPGDTNGSGATNAFHGCEVVGAPTEGVGAPTEVRPVSA